MNSDTTTPKLGQRIKAKAVMKKVKRWQTVSRNRVETEVEGIFTGVRYVWTGTSQWNDDMGNYCFTRKEQYKVWLITFNEHQNPAYALVDDCELIVEGGE